MSLETHTREMAPEALPHRGRPVLVYILLLFIAAFFLMALSFAAHKRSNEQAIGDLETSIYDSIKDMQVDERQVQALQDDGFTMVPFGQGFKDMSNPTKDLMRLVLEQSLRHDGHPILRWCMDNVFVRTDPAGNIKPDKEKSTEKIDGVVALIMALDRAQRNLNGGSVYDDRGLLTLDW